MDSSNRTPGLGAKHNEAQSLVAQMTLDEKTAFTSGKNFWHLEACERLGVGSIMVTDGPHGLRKQQAAADHVGLNAAIPATCFPTACALASSWDVELLRQIGVALGEQCIAENVAVLLGPGMNIKRHPLCGRNFEYFSEDPLLTGELAAAMINGVQSQGVGTSVKHYAVNNQEHGRMFVDAIVDERTLREIYLRGFEIAVRKAQPWTVMCAYNRVNGTYCSEHGWLIERVLRDEWGFEGLVMTDWGAANDRVGGVASGLDLEMPGSGGINDARVLAAVVDGRLPEATLDRSVARIVALSLCGAEASGRNIVVDHQAHHALARRAAAESGVLLKNDDRVLPLPDGARIAVIGAFAQRPRYQGAGSSQVTPTQLDCAYDAIVESAGDPDRVVYAPGYDPMRGEPDEELVREAAIAAGSVDVAVVFAGLSAINESEGFDRVHMRLPEQHDRLIESVCAANPNTVVVLFNGAPVEMPWVDAPKAILESYLPGQAGGSAVADILFGRASPGGRLAETFPLRRTDVPSDRWYPGSDRQVQYREGLYVGYRYYDSAAAPVLFPFGHGLSYTTFGYTNLTVARTRGGWRVEADVTNTGNVSGSEVVQLYVHDIESTAYRPVHELKAFTKVELRPDETRRVNLLLDESAFAVFDPGVGGWVVEGGSFEVRLGASSRDIRLTERIAVPTDHRVSDVTSAVAGPAVSGGDIRVPESTFADMLGHPVPLPEPVRPFHINSTLSEIEQTWLGRLIRNRAMDGFKRQIGVSSSDPTLVRMFEEMANGMPLRALALFSRGAMSFRTVHLLVALLNRRYIDAIALMLRARSTR